jgi:hypothetical protein
MTSLKCWNSGVESKDLPNGESGAGAGFAPGCIHNHCTTDWTSSYEEMALNPAH